MVPERKTVFKAHRRMISEELGKGCEAASIKNVHSILPSKGPSLRSSISFLTTLTERDPFLSPILYNAFI